jgi:hypothetical protein
MGNFPESEALGRTLQGEAMNFPLETKNLRDSSFGRFRAVPRNDGIVGFFRNLIETFEAREETRFSFFEEGGYSV